MGDATRRKIDFNTLQQNAVISGQAQTQQQNVNPEILKATPGTKDEKKFIITFQVNESTKNALENYRKRNDMTQTEVIKKAIREMLQRENSI